MLGKQWLNRYASTDTRGTAIERSKDRQKKLDGIVAWYFDTVMESLPLMLQIALLLLGCALSLFLWEINITVASVVVGVTSFGTVFYLFIVVAGLVFESFPYQTPGARFLRHILLPALRSAPSTISNSELIKISHKIIGESFRPVGPLMRDLRSSFKKPWYSPRNIPGLFSALTVVAIVAPTQVAIDTIALGICGAATPFFLVSYSWWLIRRQYMRYLNRQAVALDLRCISWMLEMSLDKGVHLSALEHLEPLMSMPTHLDPALVGYCFDVFISCINVSNREVVIMQGSERLATVSALCFFHTISYLSVMEPTSNVLNDVVQRYTKVFPDKVDFRDHPFSHAMNAVDRIFIRGEPHYFKWDDYKPPSDEHTITAHTFLKLARFTYRRTRQGDTRLVPRQILSYPFSRFIFPINSNTPLKPLRPLTMISYLESRSLVLLWILNFALHSLSIFPLPLKPVVTDCLSIIAVDLDCDVPNTGTTTLDERCVHSL